MKWSLGRVAIPACFVVLFAGNAWPVEKEATPEEEFAQALKDNASIAPGGENAFGESIGPATGELSFLHEDIVLEGIGPTITLARATRTQQHPERAEWPAFGDWDLSVPRIETLLRREADGKVPSGEHWRVALGPSLARCTQFDAPHLATDDWWHGYDFVTTDGGRQPLLKRAPENTWSLPTLKSAAGDPMVFPALTLSQWQFGCLPSTANGEPGEAFLAVAPDGTKYWLDHLAVGPARPVLEDDPDAQVILRVFAQMLVTRVEDRFGNWVRYHHDGHRLTGITARDGRAVSITWNAQYAVIDAITVMPGTALQRTWRYGYEWVVPGGSTTVLGARLRTVTLPDGSAWRFAGEVGALNGPTASRIRECTTRTGDVPISVPTQVATVTSPSGAVGTFERIPLWRSRSLTPSTCVYNARERKSFDSHPPVYGAYALAKRTTSGPGLPARTWTWTYSPAQGSTRQDACAATNSCATDAWVDVRDPDGHRTRRTFSTRWGITEGQHLRTDVYQGESTLLRSEVLLYAAHDQGPWPARIGLSRLGARSNVERLERLAPLVSRTITQQGVTFASHVEAFDVFARPVRTQRASSLGYSRTDAVAFADNLQHWVLGQVASSTNVDTGLVESRTTYDAATALPIATYAFGKLQQSRTWHPDGTLASMSGGRDTASFDTTVRYSEWKRGTPQRIAFPDGTERLALVDDLGQVAWMEDELGNRTCQQFDAMGRLTRTTYPADTPHVCDESRWNPMVRSFTPSTTTAFGIPAGHWKEQVSTGDGTTVTHYDALLRPLVVERFDSANKAATTSQVVTRYAPQGAVAFQSYPAAGVTNLATVTTGTRTAYDALGRPARIEQDSELGVLVTKHDYIAGFQTRVTAPNGKVTQTGYQAYDEPSTDQVRGILHPEGVATDIPRDVFGKPQYITRRSADWSTAVTRWYAYNAAQELCRVTEPETGATLMGYDAAGNLAWSAAGLATGTPCDDASDATLARKSPRTYDNRNRLTLLEFADDIGEQVLTYTPDGLPATVWTYNAPNRGQGVFNAFSYNSRRLLGGAGEMQHQSGWYTWTLGYGYDRNGFQTVHLYPDTSSYVRTVDALGQTTGITGTSGTYVSDASYFPNGALKQFTYGNGIVHALQQNLRGLPDRSRDAHGSLAVLDDSYDYDFNGNVASISDGLPGGRGSRTMTYDGLDRLRSVHSPMYGGTMAYTYDVQDNIETLVAPVNGANPARNLRYCYQDNRLAFVRSSATSCTNGAAVTSLTFDPQGNLRSKNAQAFVFSQDNRLRESTGGETYRYDAHGRRVASVSPTLGTLLSFYDKGGQLTFQMDGRQGKNLAHVHLAGSLVATREQPTSGGAAVLKFHHTDALGSPVAVTDANRTVIERSEYEPYGKVLNRPAHDRPGFTGHVEDRQTGLVYMQQRYFDPETGMFLSVDPVTVYETPDMRLFTRYTYAYNNPYTFQDPDGRFGVVGALIGAGIEVALQLATQGRVSNWTAVGVSGAVGAVTGGVGGLIGRAAVRGAVTTARAVAATAAVGGAAGAAGKVAEGALTGQPQGAKEVAVAAAAGAAGGAVGGRVGLSSVAKIESMAASNGLAGHIGRTTQSAMQQGGKAVEPSTSAGQQLGQAAAATASSYAEKNVNK